MLKVKVYLLMYSKWSSINMLYWQRFLKKLNVFKKILFKYIYYYDGSLHAFHESDGILKLQQVVKLEHKILFLIVGRQCYTEKKEQYPVTSNKELKKLLKLNAENRLAKSIVQSKKDDHSYVNSWFFEKELPTAVFTLPVSFLFMLREPTSELYEVDIQHPFYVTRKDSCIYSTLKTPVINNATSFLYSIGAVSDLNVIKVNKERFVEELTNINYLNVLKYLPSFFTHTHKPLQKNEAKALIYPLVFTLFAYAVASTLYLYANNFILNSKVEQLTKSIDSVFTLQATLEEQNIRYSAINQFLSDKHVTSPVWDVMAEHFSKTKFDNISLDKGRFVIRGTAKQATDVLSLLSSHSMVKSAQFDFPVMKNQYGEFFAISFSLSDVEIEKLSASGDMQKAKNNE